MHLVARPHGLGGHDRARESAVACRIRASVEIDPLHESRVDDAGSDEPVVEQRHANAVDEIADVAWRCATHEKVRKAADNRHDSRGGFDGAERVAERARQLSHLFAGEAGRVGGATLTAHDDFERRLWRRLGSRGRRDETRHQERNEQAPCARALAVVVRRARTFASNAVSSLEIGPAPRALAPLCRILRRWRR